MALWINVKCLLIFLLIYQQVIVHLHQRPWRNFSSPLLSAATFCFDPVLSGHRLLISQGESLQVDPTCRPHSSPVAKYFTKFLFWVSAMEKWKERFPGGQQVSNQWMGIDRETVPSLTIISWLERVEEKDWQRLFLSLFGKAKMSKIGRVSFYQTFNFISSRHQGSQRDTLLFGTRNTPPTI